ncbi:hypothetical protein Taro_036868 [Colocasia esculenta]|uniref:Uncharacterized protein n=1 Tax=Colocasia esculenta TaxID=4460 RepID=A0A843W818_COLES|nr:hypothetical protein [Colocasia esculenta]
MVGGGSRKDDGSVGISSNNVFAALDSLRKKKKSDKSKASSKSKPEVEQQPAQVFWAPTPLTVKSWADVDEEDDDDYYATTAPPQPVWASSVQQDKESAAAAEEESETDDDGLDEMYEDVEEEADHELEIQRVHAEPVKKPLPVLVFPKDTERQLSKKELKKKELAELDAVLAELGISAKESNAASQNEAHGASDEKKTETNGNTEKESVPAPSESKTSKKKKKKEKPPREVKDLQEQLAAADGNGTDEVSTEPGEDASKVDLDRLKKMASMKKKKSSKEMDAAAKAASVEAAARRAKLAAAKKKEKNHYNQQPVR